MPRRERTRRGHQCAVLLCPGRPSGCLTGRLEPVGSGLCSAEKAWAGSQREGGRAEGEEQTGGQLCVAISTAASPQEPPGRAWGALHRSLTALSGIPHGRPEVRGSRRSRGTRPGGPWRIPHPVTELPGSPAAVAQASRGRSARSPGPGAAQTPTLPHPARGCWSSC